MQHGSTPPRPHITHSLLASELYAISQSDRCTGEQECHWCSAPCKRIWLHDDVPLLPFVRSKSTARRPANHWICSGCFRYRWRRTTVRFLTSGFKDNQTPSTYSWLISREDAVAVRSPDYLPLYQHLCKPPLTFILSLVDEGVENHLQLMKVNDLPEIKADTPLTFTHNHVPHTYTVYELEHAIQHGPDGTEPGVQTLLRILGVPPKEETEEVKKRGRGRPLKGEEEDPLQHPSLMKRSVRKMA